MIRRLQWLVKNKEDKEITSRQEEILQLYQRFHRAFMLWAETYQSLREGDWTRAIDWLCSQAEYLEVKLGVGVMEEEILLPLRGV